MINSNKLKALKLPVTRINVREYPPSVVPFSTQKYARCMCFIRTINQTSAIETSSIFLVHPYHRHLIIIAVQRRSTLSSSPPQLKNMQLHASAPCFVRTANQNEAEALQRRLTNRDSRRECHASLIPLWKLRRIIGTRAAGTIAKAWGPLELSALC